MSMVWGYSFKPDCKPNNQAPVLLFAKFTLNLTDGPRLSPCLVMRVGYDMSIPIFWVPSPRAEREKAH